MSLITGTPGDDVLTSTAADETIAGGAGNDTLRFAAVLGGPGITFDLRLQGTAQLTGAAGRDLATGIENLAGSQFADTFTGDARANRLTGFWGNDLLDGGGGDDVLAGGSALVLGGSVRVDGVLLTDDDMLVGGDGNDTVSYSTDACLGETLVGMTIEVTLPPDRPLPPVGPVFPPVFPGDPPPPDPGVLPGVRVSLKLQGSAQDTGLAGFDTLIGIENLTGSRFADRLGGDAANNILRGLEGNDILEGDLGNDLLDGGDGLDLASYAGALSGVTVYLGAASSTGAAGVDRFVSIEGLLGSAFADTLVGDAFANTLQGGAGNDRLFGQADDDVLEGGLGDDLLNGGAGTDTADYRDAPGPVRVLLGVGNAFDTISAGRDQLIGIENIFGSAFRDMLTGDGAANRIEAGGGNDLVLGGGGNDVLLGGAGEDSLTGGAGADAITPGDGYDTIRYGAASDSRLDAMDKITGFVARGLGYDRIGFEDAAGALFAGVAPTSIAFARLVLGTPPPPPGPPGVGAPTNPGVGSGGPISLPPGGSIHTAGGGTPGSPVAVSIAELQGDCNTMTGVIMVNVIVTLLAPVGDLLAPLALAASTATTLSVTQVDIHGYGAPVSVLVVNDTLAGFDPGTDMVIGLDGDLPGALSAANFFLF